MQDLLVKWQSFKKLRNKNPYFCKEDTGFLTVSEREEIIDKLFKELEILKNEEQAQSRLCEKSHSRCY